MGIPKRYCTVCGEISSWAPFGKPYGIWVRIKCQVCGNTVIGKRVKDKAENDKEDTNK